MGCCSQTTYAPWWAEQNTKDLTSLGRAAGIEDGSLESAIGQWYLYYGARQGAMEYKANHTRYQAGRMGRSRFVNVDALDALMFERLHGREFTLLGASNQVDLNALLSPATDHVALTPSGITDRMLLLEDINRSGDIIGADPAKLTSILPIGVDVARSWILSLRNEIGFGNSVVVAPTATAVTADKVEVFDFAMLHGVTPAMEDALLGADIHSSSDFISAGADHLATVLNKPATVTTDLIEELAHYISEKGEKSKIRNKM